MRQPSLTKFFFIVMIGSSLIFVMINGAFNPFQLKPQYAVSTSDLLKLFEMEIPFLKMEVVQAQQQNDSFTQKKASWWGLVSLYTPEHPTDWMKQEIPVLSYLNLDEGKIANQEIDQDFPMELAPPPDFFQEEKNKKAESNENDSKQETEEKNIVFIYHTHNRESFLPEIKIDKANEAYHPSINITLVGQKLAEELDRLGIKTVVSTKDYWPELEKYSMSYKYSLRTVKAALAQNRDYQFIFDIHRDSHSREITTRKINGVNYGAVYFIIGTGNKNYEQNLQFAKKIDERLEQLYPGLSRGIYIKDKTRGTDGEYNQSVSPNSVTIEIGGVDNTLEEEYRGAKALAEAVADLYWQAEKVNAKPKEE